VVPPTAERVALMLDAAGLEAGAIVAVIPPTMGVATAEKVAVNAILAGCTPAELPIVIAAVRHSSSLRSNARGVSDSSNPVAPLVIVNGPIRHTAGISVAENCLGLGLPANLTVSRALRFTLRNVGSAPGVASKVTQGFPGRVAFCFGENEEASPWAPLHVERGLPPARAP